MNQTTIQILTPVLNLVIGLVVAYIGNAVVKVLTKVAPSVIEFTVAKIGLTNYTKLKAIGVDVFNLIEEDGRLGKLTDTKINTFQSLLKAKVPGVTDDEIELVRQSIAGEFNKDKTVVQEAITQAEQQVTVAAPIVKYFALDGTTELAPISTDSTIPQTV